MKIKGHEVEFIEDGHIYLVDGVITSSVTQVLQHKFNHKYDHVDSNVLNKAAIKGTEVHKAIEDYCVKGEESDIPELRNFKFLKKKYQFDVKNNEVPILLFKDDKPICAGRLDLVLEKDGLTGLADIKRTSVLDKEYLGYQLNIYRLAYMQCYDEDIKFLAGLHLRENIRKYVNIPINEDMTWGFIDDWIAANKREINIEDVFS